MTIADPLAPKYSAEDIERLMVTGGGPRVIAERLKAVESALRVRHQWCGRKTPVEIPA